MTPEEQAALDASQEKQLRDLAAQIANMTKLGFDPMTMRKGVIAAVNDTSAPPTVSINVSGDNTTLVSQVRTLNNYTPVVGQTILLAKQGTEIFILGAIASGSALSVNTETDNGWKRADLSNGSHGGNANGDVYYRRVLDHGSWKMQWRGGWNTNGSSTMIAAGGLDSDYRPSSRRSMTAARDANGSNVVKIDFNTDGSVLLVGQTTAPFGNSTGGQSTSGASPGGGTGSGGGFSVGSHTHGQVGEGLAGGFSAGSHSHSVFVDNHWHGNGSHSHSNSVDFPDWVSLNDKMEYFL